MICETHVFSSADTQNIKVYLFKCSLDWYTCFPPLVQQSECLEINQLTVLKSVTSCVMNSSHTVSCLESVLYICIMICSLDNTVIHILRFWIHSMGCMCGPVLWFWLSISGRTESSWETRRCWRWRRRSTLNFLINVSCQITVVTPLCCVSAARCRCESARCGGVQVRGEGDPVRQHEESSVSGELQAQLWGERPPWCGRVGSHLGGNLTWPRSAS